MRWSIILFLQFASFCVDVTVIDEDFYDTIIQRYTLITKTFEVEFFFFGKEKRYEENDIIYEHVSGQMMYGYVKRWHVANDIWWAYNWE